LAANGAGGSAGLKGTTTLAQLKTSYWTQPCNFTQISAIDLTAKSWSTIGIAATPFTGSYNGQNYSISNLSYTTGTAESGLFGVIKDASLSNIELAAAEVTSTANNVGLLVGSDSSVDPESSSITNIKISGVSTVTGLGNVGGIIGSLAKGSVTDSEILTGLTLTGTADYIGGIVGYTAAGTEIKDNKFGGAFAAAVTSSDLTSGCIAGNETANAGSKGTANFTTQSVGS